MVYDLRGNLHNGFKVSSPPAALPRESWAEVCVRNPTFR